MKEYYFATSNEGKFREVKEILQEIRPDINLIQKFVDIPEIQGSSEEISLHKTKSITGIDNLFTEDISLHCRGLYDMPGPYIKDTLKNVGLKNLSNLVKLSGDTLAEAKCCYTLYSGNIYITISRSIIGNIVEPKAKNGFGFDPIFSFENKRLSEMSSEEKNKISHRRLALEALSKIL